MACNLVFLLPRPRTDNVNHIRLDLGTKIEGSLPCQSILFQPILIRLKQREASELVYCYRGRLKYPSRTWGNAEKNIPYMDKFFNGVGPCLKKIVS